MGGIITLVKRSFMSFGRDRCATLSASIAYRTIFSLFPLALFGVSLLGFFIDDGTARQQVINGITGVITLGDDGEQALADTLEGVSGAKGWLGIIGLLTALWSASGLFGELRSALNQVWDVDRPRPMLRAKAQDVLLLFSFGGLIAASTASTGILVGARNAGAGWLGPLVDLAGPLFALIIFLAPLVLTFAAFMCLYKLAPHARLGWADVVPAAVIAALFFDFGKSLLSYYISNLGNFNALAGSLGAAILFLVFVYYAAQVILFAAEVAKHRMLVKAGTVPATNPKIEKAKVSLAEKAKNALKRLWAVGEPHHDSELPYQPSRLDPATNRPNNTKELVFFKIRQAQEHAAQDGQAPPPPDTLSPTGMPKLMGATFAAETGLLEGIVKRYGETLALTSGGFALPLSLGEKVRVTRDEKQIEAKDVEEGDFATAVLDKDGQLVRLYVAGEKEKAQAGGGAGLTAVAGSAAALYVRWRQSQATRKQAEAKVERKRLEQVRKQRKKQGKEPELELDGRSARRAEQLRQ